MMAVTSLSILVIAPSGIMRNAILSTLRSVPGMGLACAADNLEQALVMVNRQQPEIIFLDMALQQEQTFWDILLQLQSLFPGVNCVVLVDSYDQQRRALDLGAERALLRGQIDGELISVLCAPFSHPAVL